MYTNPIGVKIGLCHLRCPQICDFFYLWFDKKNPPFLHLLPLPFYCGPFSAVCLYQVCSPFLPFLMACTSVYAAALHNISLCGASWASVFQIFTETHKCGTLYINIFKYSCTVQLYTTSQYNYRPPGASLASVLSIKFVCIWRRRT